MIRIIQIIILSAVFIFPQEIRERTEEAIKSAYSVPVTLEMIKYNIPREIKSGIESEVRQKFFAEEVYIYKIFSGKELLGYAVLDNVYGKSMPITFLVIFEMDGTIRNSGIIKYREQYGGQVGNKSWMDQFKGKGSVSGYNIGTDVNSISGATISVHSVTAGIRKSALLLHKIKEKL